MCSHCESKIKYLHLLAAVLHKQILPTHRIGTTRNRGGGDNDRNNRAVRIIKDINDRNNPARIIQDIAYITSCTRFKQIEYV